MQQMVIPIWVGMIHDFLFPFCRSTRGDHSALNTQGRDNSEDEPFFFVEYNLSGEKGKL